jgi:hypothetical protein
MKQINLWILPVAAYKQIGKKKEVNQYKWNTNETITTQRNTNETITTQRNTNERNTKHITT